MAGVCGWYVWLMVVLAVVDISGWLMCLADGDIGCCCKPLLLMLLMMVIMMNIFQDDQHHSSRTEDAIIAWTWRKFLDNESDADILLRLPMTKVRKTLTIFIVNKKKRNLMS